MKTTRIQFNEWELCQIRECLSDESDYEQIWKDFFKEDMTLKEFEKRNMKYHNKIDNAIKRFQKVK